MNKKIIVSLMIVFACVAASFAFGDGGKKVTVQVIPGSDYSHVKWYGIVPVRLAPQIAVWVEDGVGRYLGTLFISRKAAENGWIGGKDLERPEALPVYFGRTGGRDVDAVSGTTPKGNGEIRLAAELSLPDGTYTVFAEINVSFDYNDTYPEKISGVNGQPSLVYSGTLTIGAGESSVALVPVGTGDPAGRNGDVSADLSGLTTALKITERITVTAR